MLETVNDFGRKVTALFEAGQYCAFAPPEKTLGVIDTSACRDGSRGIAFLCDEIRTCFDGTVMRAGYRDICSVTIIRSFETTFDDELQIDAPTGCIRITDCSLNKFFLKQMINSLCRIYYTMREDVRNAMYDSCSAAAMEHFAGEIPAVQVEPAAAEAPKLPEPQPEIVPAEIPDGKIEWLSGEKKAVAREEELTASELPEDMSRDEAMTYLLDSINEINSDDEDEIDEIEAIADEELIADTQDEPLTTEASAQEQGTPEAAPDELPTEPAIDISEALGLTKEPDSDDIYIKASRRLREFCVEGRLTMEQMESAVKENMVNTAEMYSELTADNEIPEIIAARVEMLKDATERLSDYFAMGEDIAARVMFFMLYQMLSYSDRIIEQEDTKERLNDFFRRYGPAGLALSLIDSGI
ncbi:MAG: hypothetical protein IJZ47_05565 [Oscillospiraceae bacterium]|nr:hypothetical protein [Oscillospiraceae bacterium]